MRCVFASDLHGKRDRYAKLQTHVAENPCDVVFLGGDLLPHSMVVDPECPDFLRDALFPMLREIREHAPAPGPEFVVILGNDDARGEEVALYEAQDEGLLHYVHGRRAVIRGQVVYGYSFIPPSPFALKDWEKYDVSRFVDPGCSHPTEGFRSVDPEHRPESSTIAEDLERLVGDEDLSDAIFLFHAPPYRSCLDRAALDGRSYDHAPLDVHVGSIAIRRFLEQRQPRLSLHGHVHESVRITGSWREEIGRCVAMGAAHDGPELCVVTLDSTDLDTAERHLL